MWRKSVASHINSKQVEGEIDMPFPQEEETKDDTAYLLQFSNEYKSLVHEKKLADAVHNAAIAQIKQQKLDFDN